jgi:hypothetical protein
MKRNVSILKATSPLTQLSWLDFAWSHLLRSLLQQIGDREKGRKIDRQTGKYATT